MSKYDYILHLIICSTPLQNLKLTGESSNGLYFAKTMQKKAWVNLNNLVSDMERINMNT